MHTNESLLLSRYHLNGTHQTQCNFVSSATNTAYHSTTYGINFDSPLNDLEYYHVTDYRLPPDPMHDILEGYTYKITKLTQHAH